MMVAAEPISRFVEAHRPSRFWRSRSAADRVVAGRRQLRHTSKKGYIYFAMGFSVFVEMINIRIGKRDRHHGVAAPVPGRNARRLKGPS